VVEKLYPSIAIYNNALRMTAERFRASHWDVQTVIVFDAQPVFNTLLDNAKTFGFVNSTGWCEAYQSGTPSQTTQVPPCAPVSNYL
jgi:phospholipase/lecithinase/hemolysin